MTGKQSQEIGRNLNKIEFIINTTLFLIYTFTFQVLKEVARYIVQYNNTP